MSLFNLANVLINELSALSDEMLKRVTSKSGDRYIKEIAKSFENELNKIEVNEDLDEETLKISREMEFKIVPESTQKQSKYQIKRFKEFLHNKNVSDKIETVLLSILGNYLSYFYYSLETNEVKPHSHF